MIRFAISLITLCLVLSPAARADQTLVWNNAPVPVLLPVGKEVRFIFPTEVTLQVPDTVIAKLDSLAPNQQIVYWTAKEAFDSARVIAMSLDGTSVYLIDLSASAKAPSDNLRLEDPARIVVGEVQDAVPSSHVANVRSLEDPVEIVLTRYASQTLYAPKRLMPASGEIFVQRGASISSDFPLLRSQYGERYHVEVVGAWSGYGRYITAVLVINQGARPVAVNPGLVQGDFTHITPQHLQLGPRDTLEDRTTLYLISDVPFMAALGGDRYGY